MSTVQMSTLDVANALIELCRQGKNDEAIRTLYADDIVSIEAGAPPGQNRESAGIEAVVAKGKWWEENHIVHDGSVNGPWPNGDQFIVTFRYDITFKPEDRRFTMEEAALYTVRDGKIAREEFFYAM